MVLDTSAVVSVILSEDDAEQIKGALSVSEVSVISAPTLLESRIVLGARIGASAKAKLDAFMSAANVGIMDFTEGQSDIAAEAWRRYGRGSGSSAKLNFGDCFSYALARSLDAPLLFKGDDFAATDVTAALLP
ncbi:type II toxin-antitoxin system VapC family toxin [Jiella mangrovi]|uniref:Ribonuclease VapC n=1 Tax=Jiella mangrovi TaxID=2821407 RepID=A0ABS4BIG4_9HYPH|nr:type II toxin-antitoxin system VapC family toxin [Jiella mangrovi]MBP0615966.1 type II toxin-antitoxin system VapC family toxin [Jiella mangrovi]